MRILKHSQAHNTHLLVEDRRVLFLWIQEQRCRVLSQGLKNFGSSRPSFQPSGQRTGARSNISTGRHRCLCAAAVSQYSREGKIPVLGSVGMNPWGYFQKRSLWSLGEDKE